LQVLTIFAIAALPLWTLEFGPFSIAASVFLFAHGFWWVALNENFSGVRKRLHLSIKKALLLHTVSYIVAGCLCFVGAWTLQRTSLRVVVIIASLSFIWFWWCMAVEVNKAEDFAEPDRETPPV
jgi:hypothetical protein